MGLILLAIAGFIAASINGFAGGGTLISFPVLIGTGLQETVANATNAVALWPGSLASAVGFKKYFEDIKKELIYLTPPTILGSAIGAFLLVSTPKVVFKFIIPLLILTATLLLAFQKMMKPKHGEPTLPHWAAWVLQMLVAIYGGYFGAGMGILMLAILGVASKGDIHRHNALKSILAIIINFSASGILIYQGLVNPSAAVAVMVGSIFGGYTSAKVSMKVSADKLRMVIVVFGFVMTAWFVWRAFNP